MCKIYNTDTRHPATKIFCKKLKKMEKNEKTVLLVYSDS